MSTVGYGDLYAVTNFGRLTGIFIMFWGAFINSLDHRRNANHRQFHASATKCKLGFMKAFEDFLVLSLIQDT
jgi:hypothetical protein